MPNAATDSEQLAVPIGMHDEVDLRTIKPARWQWIFRELALDVSAVPLVDGAPDVELQIIRHYLTRSAPLQSLISAAMAIRDDRSRDLLFDSAQRLGIDPWANFPQGEDRGDETPTELASRFWLLGTTDVLAKQALEEAQIRIDPRIDRFQQCFPAREARRVPTWTAEHRAKIEAGVREHLASQHVTPFVECTFFSDADGALVLKIVHGEPTIAIPAILPTGRVVYRLQREQGDIIRYSPKGLLSISCSKAPLLRHYVPLCGRVFFQDATFFPQVPSIFLNVLLDEAAIQEAAKSVDSIRRAALTKVTVWDDGGFVHAMSHKTNVHPAVRRNRLESTQVKRAEITLWLHEPGNPKDVAYTIRLEPPFKRHMDEHSVHQPAAQVFLEELGIFEKPKFQDRAAGNWLAFQPWRMPEPEWQRLSNGKDVQPLIESGVLTRVRLDHLIEPTVAAGPIPIVIARTGEQVAVPADPFAVPLRVSPTQILGLEWNPRLQAQVIATALGTTGAIGDLVFDSIMDLGSRDLGSGHTYHAYLFLSNPSDAELESLRQRAGGPPLGFVPSGVPKRRLFDTVPIRLPALDFPGLHQLALQATRLEHLVTALETAHPEDQFAIDFQTGRIWWVPTRQELDLEALPEQARDHFLCIARNSWREGCTHLDVSSPVPHLTIRTDTHRDSHVGQEAFVRAMTRIADKDVAKPLIVTAPKVGYRLQARVHARNRPVTPPSIRRP